MSLYRYRAKDRKGHKYKGIREGENEAQLVKSLAEDGLYCYFLQNEDTVSRCFLLSHVKVSISGRNIGSDFNKTVLIKQGCNTAAC